MPDTQTLIVRYALFAGIATLANIAAQEASILAYAGANHLTVSILAGTAAGFVVKYVLDKFFIFYDTTTDATREAAKMFLYGATAIVTTLIFWGVELGAWAIWHTAFAKYSGAVLGLSIGYVVKYLLDRRYVFGRARAA